MGGVVLCLAIGVAASIWLRHTQVRYALQQFVLASSYEENPRTVHSYLRLVHSTVQAALNSGSLGDSKWVGAASLTLVLCQSGTVVARFPIWDVTGTWSCQGDKNYEVGALRIRTPVPFIGENVVLEARAVAPWIDAWSVSIGTSLLLLGLTIWGIAYRSRRERWQIHSVFQCLDHDLADIPPMTSKMPIWPHWTPQAVVFLREKILQLRKRLQTLQEEQSRARADAAVGEVAEQVAHDIRSPLTVLEYASRELSEIPEGKRVLFYNAVSRIRAIATDLGHMSEGLKGEDGSSVVSRRSAERPVEASPLLPILQEILAEKRVQYIGRPGLKFELVLEESAYHQFVKVRVDDFKRILSNLINNSADSIAAAGVIQVRVERDSAEVRVSISDTGRGIPAEILERLGTRGASFEKPGGMGLGLYHARRCIEDWSGVLEIQSNPGCGTTIGLRLQAVTPPRWFLPRLSIPANSTFVIVDDDPSIHALWEERFSSFHENGKGTRFELLHFHSAPDFTLWMTDRKLPETRSGLRFLIDLDLGKGSSSGLELIKAHDLRRHVTLVTSRHDDSQVREQCVALGCTLLPKCCAERIPIEFANPVEHWDAILIDDDPEIRWMWGEVALQTHHRFRSFESVQSFLAIIDEISFDTPIYVDSRLGDGLRGEDLAQELRVRGFTKIYLTTGLPHAHFPQMSWVDSIVDKRAPWAL